MTMQAVRQLVIATAYVEADSMTTGRALVWEEIQTKQSHYICGGHVAVVSKSNSQLWQLGTFFQDISPKY